ncbi:hypothetical protein JZ751_010517, partial [Albula glossodonta]
MFQNLSSDYDSSSRCSTSSPAGDTLTYNQQSPDDSFSGTSASPMESTEQLDSSIVPPTAISGNSNILLCSSVAASDLEPPLEVKDEPLDSWLPGLGKVSTETARSVPDVDLSGSLGAADWETLYKSVSNDLEPLSTPVVTSTPSCTSYLSLFSFTYPEFDSSASEGDSCKGAEDRTDLAIDILNSPTLLA